MTGARPGNHNHNVLPLLYNIMSMNKKTVIILLAILIILSACMGNIDEHYYSTPISSSHEVIGQKPITLEKVWKQKFFPGGGFGIECSGNNNIIYLQGFMPDDMDYGSFTLALDNTNGNILWYAKHDGETTFSNDRIFIADLVKVSALDKLSGKVLWETNLPFFSRNISKLFFYNGKLYAGTTGNPGLVVLTEDGKILEQLNSLKGLSSVHPDIPKFYLHESGPIDIDRYIIYLDGNKINIYDNQSRLPVFQVKDIESNITPINNQILYLAENNYLELYDPIKNTSENFAAVIPTIDFNNYYQSLEVRNSRYYLCYSEGKNMLYVSLGISQELFAFKINRLEK